MIRKTRNLGGYPITYRDVAFDFESWQEANWISKKLYPIQQFNDVRKRIFLFYRWESLVTFELELRTPLCTDIFGFITPISGFFSYFSTEEIIQFGSNKLFQLIEENSKPWYGSRVLKKFMKYPGLKEKIEVKKLFSQ